MAWLQLHFPAGKRDAETLEAALEDAGAEAITLTDGADDPLFEPPLGATPLWRDTVITALFAADRPLQPLLHLLRASSGLPLAEFRAEQLQDQSWERAWLDNFKPMQFGKRLWVVPTTFTPPDATAINLILDPGLAFGTGTHETTALCLEWLDQADLAGKTVIDFGCGSGILAIAALLCGADHATGCDIDPQALIASTDNARQNGVADRLQLHLPDTLPATPANVLLANILAAPLISLSEQLAQLTLPGGALVLSGILVRQAEEVRDTYARWFNMDAPVVRGDWARLTGKRRQ